MSGQITWKSPGQAVSLPGVSSALHKIVAGAPSIQSTWLLPSIGEPLTAAAAGRACDVRCHPVHARCRHPREHSRRRQERRHCQEHASHHRKPGKNNSRHDSPCPSCASTRLVAEALGLHTTSSSRGQPLHHMSPPP